MKMEYLDHYKQWIERIECRYPQKMWVAYLLPGSTLQSRSFEKLAGWIEDHCVNEVIELAAEAMKFKVERLQSKIRGYDVTDSRQAVCIVVKEKFPGVNNYMLARKLGWANHSMVTHALKQKDVLEIKRRVNRIKQMYPFLNDYETAI